MLSLDRSNKNISNIDPMRHLIAIGLVSVILTIGCEAFNSFPHSITLLTYGQSFPVCNFNISPLAKHAFDEPQNYFEITNF